MCQSGVTVCAGCTVCAGQCWHRSAEGDQGHLHLQIREAPAASAIRLEPQQRGSPLLPGGAHTGSAHPITQVRASAPLTPWSERPSVASGLVDGC